MERRLATLELAYVFEEAKEHYKNLNKAALNRDAREASRLALSLGTLQAAKIAAHIRNMETDARKSKKKGRFIVRN
jgi:hypothetical protein